MSARTQHGQLERLNELLWNSRVICALILTLLGGIGGVSEAYAVSVFIDTSSLFGTAARLDFSLLDGDPGANSTVTIGNLISDGALNGNVCSQGCAGGPPFTLDDSTGLGQFLQDLTLGNAISFDLGFGGAGSADLLVLSLLDPNTNFTLVTTDLAAGGPVSYDNALLVLGPATGSFLLPTASNPHITVRVAEPGTLSLVLLGSSLWGWRRLVDRSSKNPVVSRTGKYIMKPQISFHDRMGGIILGTVLGIIAAAPLQAANHREAPLTALDTKADITDWFAFVSYDDPTKVTMILNVDPLLEPSNGPNYFPFDHEILYEMKVDNDFDAVEDIKIQFRFDKAAVRLPNVFTGFVGAGDAGLTAPVNSPSPVPFGTPIVPPAITALDGPGSEGLSLQQTYRVTILKKAGSTWTTVFSSVPRKLIAVPSNVGPRTMTSSSSTYEDLARQGIYDLGGGVKVFAGTVDDPFYIDLGAAFDTFNFRAGAATPGLPAGVLSDAQDVVDDKNFAPDDVSGFNVNSMAIELPITMLTQDGALHPATDALAVIGTYATTSRPRIKVQPSTPGGKPALSTNFVQIQRMGNALFNELIIGTGDKDKFSMSEPEDDAQFASYALDPLLARVFNAASGGVVGIPTPPRADPNNPQLDLGPLVFYAAPICPGCTLQQRGPVADLLRLTTGIPPTQAASRKRLGVLAGDFAGYPNGRRVSDDVTDISARAVVGVLNPAFNCKAPHNLRRSIA